VSGGGGDQSFVANLVEEPFSAARGTTSKDGRQSQSEGDGRQSHIERDELFHSMAGKAIFERDARQNATKEREDGGQCHNFTPLQNLGEEALLEGQAKSPFTRENEKNESEISQIFREDSGKQALFQGQAKSPLMRENESEKNKNSSNIPQNNRQNETQHEGQKKDDGFDWKFFEEEPLKNVDLKELRKQRSPRRGREIGEALS
jgi:hypothetical protein